MTELKIRSAISWWLWIPIYTLIIGQGIFMAQETHIATLLFHFWVGYSDLFFGCKNSVYPH